MGEAAVEGNIVPTLALDQVSEKAGENIAVANSIIEKPLPNKNTQIPPLVPKKSKSTSNIDPKVYVEESRAPQDVQDRKSRLSARRGLQLIEEETTCPPNEVLYRTIIRRQHLLLLRTRV